MCSRAPRTQAGCPSTPGSRPPRWCRSPSSAWRSWYGGSAVARTERRPRKGRTRRRVRPVTEACSNGSALLAARVELLEVGEHVVDVGFAAPAGEDHLFAVDLRLRVLYVFLEGRLVPGDAGILVRLG